MGFYKFSVATILHMAINILKSWKKYSTISSQYYSVMYFFSFIYIHIIIQTYAYTELKTCLLINVTLL